MGVYARLRGCAGICLGTVQAALHLAVVLGRLLVLQGILPVAWVYGKVK